jgi:hypothetical protein
MSTGADPAGAGSPDAAAGESEQHDPDSTAPETQPEPQPEPPGNMLPGRGRRQTGVERVLVRLVATCGILGIGVALGAILVSSKVQGWITGLAVAGVSVLLSAILWSSKQL